MIKRFEDLDVWKKAREFAAFIYSITKTEHFSKDLRFRDQIRSSSGSIMDNIAEGYERGGRKEFIQFLSIAKGSCGESRSQLYRAKDVEYINDSIFSEAIMKAESISKSLSGFIEYLKTSDYKGPKYK